MSLQHDFQLLDFDTPLVFADGTKFWNKITTEYVTHKRGYFILGPSGSGKTHFVKSQQEPHWIDGDSIWAGSNASPDGEWWLRSSEDIGIIDSRSDVMTAQAKMLGLRVVGASNYWLKPDAMRYAKQGIPQFRSVQEAASYLESLE